MEVTPLSNDDNNELKEKPDNYFLNFLKRRISFIQKKDESYYKFYLRCCLDESQKEINFSNDTIIQENYIMGLNQYDFAKLSEIIFYKTNITLYNFIDRKNIFLQLPNESCLQFYKRCFNASNLTSENEAKENFIMGLSVKHLRRLNRIFENSNNISLIDAVNKLTEMQNVTCFYCGKLGHKEFQCYKKKRDIQNEILSKY